MIIKRVLTCHLIQLMDPELTWYVKGFTENKNISYSYETSERLKIVKEFKISYSHKIKLPWK